MPRAPLRPKHPELIPIQFLPVSSYQVTPASLAKLSSEIAGLDDYRDSEETRVSTQAKYAAPVEPPGVRSIVLASTESSPAQSDSISATAYQQGGHPLSFHRLVRNRLGVFRSSDGRHGLTEIPGCRKL